MVYAVWEDSRPLDAAPSAASGLPRHVTMCCAPSALLHARLRVVGSACEIARHLFVFDDGTRRDEFAGNLVAGIRGR